MSENTKIEWADHTFNPWVGCTKVSPACDHCYAEGWAKRTGQSELWNGSRRRTSIHNWKQPLKWNRDHEKFYAEYGRRQRVFAASLADIFDNQVPEDWRSDFWQLVRNTPNLDWLLLTKRPQNIKKMLPNDWGRDGYPNVWPGTTVENQKEAERRVKYLRSIPAVVKFLSMEPLLGAVDLDMRRCEVHDREFIGNWEEGEYCTECAADGSIGDMPIGHWLDPYNGGISWVITGGESGPHARPSNPDWFRSLRDQCQAVGVAFHFKQWGEWTEAKIDNVDSSKRDYFISLDGKDETDLPINEYSLGTAHMVRIGKGNAGRLLDGRTWDEFPEVAR